MFSYNIKPLVSGDLQNVMEVFTTCFAEDEFYCKQFAEEGIVGHDEVCHTIHMRFTPQVEQVLKHNLSYGMYRDGELIAFILNFDYMRLLTSSPEWFHSMFHNGSILPYEHEMHAPIQRAAAGRGVVFLLSVAVLPEFRRKHIASHLLDRTISDNPDSLVASDVSNTASLGMYRKRCFFVRVLEENYHFVLGPNVVR